MTRGQDDPVVKMVGCFLAVPVLMAMFVAMLALFFGVAWGFVELLRAIGILS